MTVVNREDSLHDECYKCSSMNVVSAKTLFYSKVFVISRLTVISANQQIATNVQRKTTLVLLMKSVLTRLDLTIALVPQGTPERLEIV